MSTEGAKMRFRSASSDERRSSPVITLEKAKTAFRDACTGSTPGNTLDALYRLFQRTGLRVTAVIAFAAWLMTGRNNR